MKEQLVSIIIPTYKNSGEKIIRAIDSVLEQQYDPIEIIVVDDNQPDSEYRILTENAMKHYSSDKRVRYLKHTCNRNGAAARNTGIRASNGIYIGFLDDDDYFLSGKLQKEIDFLNSHSEFDAVYHFAMRETGEVISTEFAEGNLSKSILLGEFHAQTSTMMFRRSALLSINGFDERFFRHQDWEMQLRFFGSGHLIGCIPELLSVYSYGMTNVPVGKRIERIKRMFLRQFMPYIEGISKNDPTFKRRVLVRHYYEVFNSHVNNRFYLLAIWALLRYYCLAPRLFNKRVCEIASKAIAKVKGVKA